MDYAPTHWHFAPVSMEVPTGIRTLRENNGEIEVKTAAESRELAVFVDYR